MRARLVLIALAFAALGAAPSPVAPTPARVCDKIKLERTACYGRCPVYSVTVDTSSSVIDWNGEQFVARKHATANASPEQLSALQAAFADFDKYDDHYDDYDITDAPHATLTCIRATGTKVVTHYQGDTSAPAELRALEDRVDDILGTKRWI